MQAWKETFFSKDTYHAIVVATKSNVHCICHLLSVKHFRLVLTRKLSSDPIESLFGFLRRSSGSNDMLDVKSAVCGLEKILKTGILAASEERKQRSKLDVLCIETTSLFQISPNTIPGAAEKISDMAVAALKEHCLSEGQCRSNPDVASVAMVGGFTVRAASESISCQNCVALLQGPKARTPLLGLIAHQDHGGLLYVSQELLKLLVGLREFVDCVL